ncbi:hypothetical protein RYX36_020218, partial [Vicia faba]
TTQTALLAIQIPTLSSLPQPQATPTTEEQESGSMKQGQNLIKITMKLSL